MPLQECAASSAFPLLEVFNKPSASGKRAALKILLQREPRRSPGCSPTLSRFPMGAEQVCVGAQLGPALERSQEHLAPSGAWAEDAETWSGSCFLRWDAEAQGVRVVAKRSRVRRETWTPDSPGVCYAFASSNVFAVAAQLG